MELRAIRAFVEVVRRGGFSAAAKVIFATQSTVSKTVKQLEDELGMQLLDRSGHRTSLTAAGEIVYRNGLAMLTLAADLRVELEELRGLKRGSLRLGFPPMGGGLVYAGLVVAFLKQHPNIDLHLVESGSKRLLELLQEGELDVAAALLPVRREFEWEELLSGPLNLLVSASHPLARRSKVRIRELAEIPFILYGHEFALNCVILEACRVSGFIPKIVTESSQVDSIIELVAANLGVALIPKLVTDQHPHPLTRSIPVDQPPIFFNLAMIWRRGGYLSPAARAWLELARAHGNRQTDTSLQS